MYPNSIKSNVHSNFSVINLLHDVEEAISQNKFSKETDKIVKNFKEELNKDLLYNEPINRKYHKYQMGNPNNSGIRKKSKLTKQSSIMSLTELVEKLGGNDSDGSSDDLESDREVKSETCIETGQSQYLGTNNPGMNSLGDSDSNSELFRSFNNELSIHDASFKLKNNSEDIEAYKVSHNKRYVFKEKRTIKKKKTLMKEPKAENISEEERLNGILLELKKQVKVSEPPTPIFLTKNDSLTELNFEKEPCTYLSMHPSSITTDSDSQTSHLETTPPKESSPTELSEQESKQSLVSSPEPKPIFKKNKPPKSEHSSTKLYSFRIDYECIKNKPMNICNIITALERVNKLLQNIPIQYDKNTGRPYIVYDPKTIVKVIKEVNIKHEYKMIVKKCNKKAKIDSDTEKSICETNPINTSTIETTVKKDEKGLEEVGNQLLQCILISMEHPTNFEEPISCTKDKDEYNKYSQTFDQGNSNIDQSLENNTDFKPITPTTEALKSSKKNVETIGSKKKYFELAIKTATAYHISGFYHQSVIYLERQEYLSNDKLKTYHKDQENNIQENNQKTKKEKNTTKVSSGSYAELKEKYTEEFKERKNVGNEANKKYGIHLKKENRNQTESNISQKYYHRYSKTRKLLLSKYELKRNKKKESVEKGLDKPCLKIDRPESINSDDRDEKSNSFNKQSMPNVINKPESTSQIPKEPNKMYKTINDAGLIQCITGKDFKNNHIKVHKRPHFNPLITFDNMDQIITNKNDLSVNTAKNNSGLGSFSLNKSIMNNMLRSVSINTIPNTYPTRKEITKQVFYFQVTYPLINDLNDIYKKQSPQEFFKPSQHDIFSKFINYKENNKLLSYKNYINQQAIDSVNTIKNQLNNNIDNICQIVNIDNQLLIQFLKICSKQNELNFDEDKKLLMLETEMEELKSLIEEHLDKKPNPPIFIKREPKRPSVREQQKIIAIDNNTGINQSILKNGVNMEETNKNKVLKNSGLCKETINLPIENLNNCKYKKRLSEEFFQLTQYIRQGNIYPKENRKIQRYKKYINKLGSVNTIKNVFIMKHINNICQIVNINNQLLIKFLNICLKQDKLNIKEDEKLLILEKEMKELKSYMENHLGQKTNPLRLIQRNQKGLRVRGYQKIFVFDNAKIKQSALKNELNMEEIIVNNNRLCIDILRFLNFVMLIFSLFLFLQLIHVKKNVGP